MCNTKRYYSPGSALLLRSLIAVMCCGLAACTHDLGYLSLASEKYLVPANYDYDQAEKVFSTGESHQLVFYVWDVEPLASIRDAINEAVRKVDGDFITNTKITVTETGIILFARRTIKVEGTVYKLPKRRGQ
jgi:hypothetical protein